MSPLDLTVDAIALCLILHRQHRIRRVRLHFAHRVPVLLSVVGLLQFFHYTETHSLGTRSVAVVLGSCLVGAWALGTLRAATVRLREVGRGTMTQQASWLTLVLWLVSVGVQFSLGIAVAHLGGPVGAVAGSGGLFLAVTLAVQNAVVHRRAVQTLRAGGAGVSASRAGALDARSSEEPHG